LIFWKYSSRRS